MTGSAVPGELVEGHLRSAPGVARLAGATGRVPSSTADRRGAKGLVAQEASYSDADEATARPSSSDESEG